MNALEEWYLQQPDLVTLEAAALVHGSHECPDWAEGTSVAAASATRELPVL